ncbi:cytochrome P450 [Streptomyces sp. NPDC091268]|uniref:cytochrome P450 n=1 Tax=Streptomyces sp. NPDC091268 TaxID=3365979 RepID=UPI0037F91BA8
MLPVIDHTVPLLVKGYGWLPDLRRRHGGAAVVRTRIAGRPTVVLHGPGAVEFFYDERNVRRHGALPGPVLDTLFGRGAVHTLDGDAHRVRKGAFVSLLMRERGIEALLDLVGRHWDEAVPTWAGREVVLFEETARVLARAVCDWAGLPVSQERARELAADCLAMVDGFATAGPRHWRARAARGRQERALTHVVEEVRAGVAPLGPAAHHGDGGGRSVLETVARHRDADGRLPDSRTAAVELLNIIRPTVAISWFAAFAAHALHRDPRQGEALRSGDGSAHAGGLGDAYALAFAHEVRRFYPFVPFLGALAARDTRFGDEPIEAGSMVLLDVYGQHHDPALWPDPYRFVPQRFLGNEIAPGVLIPQGGGDPSTGHRCPGEDITVRVLARLATALARLDAEVPRQDLAIPLDRIPTRPRSGFVVRVAARRSSPERGRDHEHDRTAQ